MNLVSHAFKSPFSLVTSFVTYFSRIFFNAGARKGRYLCYLRSEVENNLTAFNPAGQKVTITMPLNTIATRWNPWLLCVSYHSKYFQYNKAFLKLKCSLQNRHPNQLKNCTKCYNEDIEKYQELKACMSFLANKASAIMSFTDIFQSRLPLTVKAYDHLEDLQILFATNQQLPDESFAQFTDEIDEINLLSQQDIRIMFQVAFDGAQEKLQKQMGGAQPGIKFLVQVRIFCPSRVSILSRTKLEYTAISLFTNVPDEEFTKYVEL